MGRAGATGDPLVPAPEPLGARALRLFRVQAFDDFIQQFSDARPVFRRNLRDGIEPELKKFHRRLLRALVVGLVDREHDWNTGLSQFARDALIAGNQPFASVDQKDQQIGADDGTLPCCTTSSCNGMTLAV